MKQIRRSIFETNSSSTHSLTVVSKEDWDKWEKGDLVFSDDSEPKFVKPEENTKDEWSDDDNEECMTYKTFDEFWEDLEYETFEENHITKSGDNIVIFGYYGYNG